MRLLFENNKFICQSTYEEKNIPREAGFSWNSTAKHWSTTNLDAAIQLQIYADNPTKLALERLLEKRNEKIRASYLTDATVEIPVPEGRAYFGYQKAGIGYAMERNATLLADEMGLGKTVQAIGVINAKNDINKVLIICPASLKINWQREFSRWLVRPLTIGIVNKNVPDSDIVIINYDLLSKFKAQLDKDWDLVVLDEAHYVKNSKAKRSKEAKAVTDKANIKILITGTPIANRPAELWHLLHILSPTQWNNFFSFAKRYCNAKCNKYGWDFSGASNLGELQNILRESLMVRRLKNEVLTELPQKRRQIIEIEPEGKQLAELIKQNCDKINSIENLKNEKKTLKKQKNTMSEEEYRNAVNDLKARTAASIGEIALLRHKTALAKVPTLAEHCKSMLEETDKIVMFAHHKDVIDEIKQSLSEYLPVSITGDMSINERQESVDKFQSDDNCRVFIGSITAAGVGITLTAASTVIFAELDWVPGNLSQAEDRCHRIGQKDSVLVQHVIFENSIDAYLAQKIVLKQEIIEQAVDITKELASEPISEESELIFNIIESDDY